jgi:hypothetical protein
MLHLYCCVACASNNFICHNKRKMEIVHINIKLLKWSRILEKLIIGWSKRSRWAYADDVNLLENNICALKKNIEALIYSSNENGLYVNTETTTLKSSIF